MADNPFFRKDIVSIKDFSKDDLYYIFKATQSANELGRKELSELAKGKILGYIFYEPSTRTRISFESAMATLGGSSIGITEPKTSSIQKGESLSDTIRIMDSYSDIILLRHPLEGSGRLAGEIAENPVINAGSGSEEHPTQAMLDLYTIYNEKKRIDGLNIAIIGDLKYSRTVYSLLHGLSKFSVNISLISPSLLRVRKEYLDNIESMINIKEYTELNNETLSRLDIIYVTRIQEERFPDSQEYEKVKGTYKIDKDVLSKAKKDISVMHPLPRRDEISKDIDYTKNAIYFKQASLGKMMRSALLALMLNENPF